MLTRASNGIVLNTKAIALCVTALLFFLYVAYTWNSGKSSTHLKRSSTWKTNDFVDIPADVKEAEKTAKIEEKEVKVEVGDQSLKIFYREAPGMANSKAARTPHVVMLHGASSSSEVWQEIGTMKLIAAMGHTAIAVDLPGWAKSKESKLKEGRHADFLNALFKELHLKKPVLISASMSGKYVIPYLLHDDPTECHERASGFVPLAPVSTEAFEHSIYHRCEIPTMIVHGTKDKTLGLTALGNLRNMPNSEIMQMEGAGHAGYQNRPEEWNRLLYNFLLAIQRM